MSRNKPFFDNESEMDKTIALYEEQLATGESFYMDADILADIADHYAAQERFDDAQQAITYGLRLHPGNTDLLVQQSLLYLDTQQLDKAIEVADSITDVTNDVVILRGELLLNQGKEPEAEAIFRSVQDKDYDFMADITCLYKDSGYPTFALKWVNEALELYPNEEELWLMKAESHTLLQESEPAAAIYNKLLDKEPYNVELWLGLAKTHFAVQEFTQALNAIDFALVADEKCGEAYLLRGHILLNLERSEEGIECYHRSIEMKAIEPTIGMMFIAVAHVSLQQWERAHQAFVEATSHAQESFLLLLPDIHIAHAAALGHLGRFEEAHALCRKAQKELPNDSESHFVEGQLFLMQDDADTAWHVWQEALRLSEDKVDTLVRISDSFLIRARWEDARRCFEEILLLDPNYDRIYMKLAILSLLMGDETSFRAYSLYVSPPLEIEQILEVTDRIEERDDNKNFWDLIDKLKKEQS